MKKKIQIGDPIRGFMNETGKVLKIHNVFGGDHVDIEYPNGSRSDDERAVRAGRD